MERFCCNLQCFGAQIYAYHTRRLQLMGTVHVISSYLWVPIPYKLAYAIIRSNCSSVLLDRAKVYVDCTIHRTL